MNRTKIEWADFTWNPMVGCKHGCDYCYAERINRRFSLIPDWGIPRLFPDRLYDPSNITRGSIIFVGSMTDMMGNWWKDAQIQSVIDSCKMFDNHLFVWLSKNPKRYFDFHWPPNCLLGFTVTNQHHLHSTLKMLIKSDQRYFLNIEPVLSEFTYSSSVLTESYFSMIIVGAMTGPKAKIPPINWIRSITRLHRDDQFFWKENIRKHYPLLPRGDKKLLWDTKSKIT